MVRPNLALGLAFAMLASGTAQAGPFDAPDPKLFARAEDQERARLLSKPCNEADVGRGCYRYNGHSFREAPCSYHIDASTIGSLPTDQCYKMDKDRRYRGVWVDEFEGQRFIPEGTNPPEWPKTDPQSPGWKEQAERARLATIWIDTSRINVARNSRRNGARRLIDFVGRKTMFSGAYGHMGMSGQEIIVDRVISLRDCPPKSICR